MKTSIKVDGNKYEVIYDFQADPIVFKALRHGEEWRDLIGDNLIYWLCMEIEVLKEKLADVETRHANLVKATEQPARNWKGCKVCFGSGGKKIDPCKVCNGTGKVAR